ncbi:MAG TPA: hypothetical protein PKX05_00430 [bacterium]|nr:hypothetical protein [bacterium]
MNLIVYVRDREFYFYYSEGKSLQGVFESDQDLSKFFTENKVKNLFLIFSRPLIFIRSLEFPFSSLNKISQILPEESTSLFPVGLEELELFWYPVGREKTRTSVLIMGIEKKRIEKWQNIKASFRFNMKVGFEPFVLANYVSKTISDRNYTIIFIDKNYIAKYRVENNIVVEGSSCFFEQQDYLDEYLNGIKNEKINLPVIVLGDLSPNKLMPNFRMISPKKSESCISMFFALFQHHPNLSILPVFKIFTVSRSEITVNPALICGLCVYLGIAGLMFRPVILARHYQEKVADVNKQMEEVFRVAFPDVSRIVNPLIQAKEHLKNFQDVQKVMPKISVISIMATISGIIPEHIPFKISQMSLRGNDLFLTCLTDTLENVEIVSQIFKKAEMFGAVKIGGITPEAGQITFNLLIKIKNVQN